MAPSAEESRCTEAEPTAGYPNAYMKQDSKCIDEKAKR